LGNNFGERQRGGGERLAKPGETAKGLIRFADHMRKSGYHAKEVDKKRKSKYLWAREKK